MADTDEVITYAELDEEANRLSNLFRSIGLRHLTVVDEDGRAAGMLTRKELMCAFDRDLC